MTLLNFDKVQKATSSESGIILPDSELGLLLGFVSTKFDGYMFYNAYDKELIISLIKSKDEGNGNCTRFIQRLKKSKLVKIIRVYSPSCILNHILQKEDFHVAIDDEGETCLEFVC